MPHKVPVLEQPVLEKLINIRAKLSAIKRNRSSYLTMEDIMPIRLETEEEMKLLSSLRGGRLLDPSRELNRADDVLDEILQMLSLCFLSLGKKRESPAVYSQVVTIQHIFDRLDAFGVYDEEYLKAYKTKLDEIDKILNVDSRNQALPDTVMQVLKYKFMQCNRIYQNLIDTIHEVSPKLIPIQNKMLGIRRDLVIICCRSEFSPSDIKPLQEKIRALDAQREDGKFVADDGTVPPGQAVLVGLLEQLFYWSHDLMLVCTDSFSPELQSIRERLVEIKCQLDRLQLTHKWTLRQTDLFTYQHQLHDIVKMIYGTNADDEESQEHLCGKFLGVNGEAPEGQTVLQFLLNKCYRTIFELLSGSVPVSEALTPVYNQLLTVKQCLQAVKETGAPCSPEELYPYQMKIMSIEDLRKDGKFYDDRGHIPEGNKLQYGFSLEREQEENRCQAVCIGLLEECYSLLGELRDTSDDD